jgi:hypothetical protein
MDKLKLENYKDLNTNVILCLIVEQRKCVKY